MFLDVDYQQSLDDCIRYLWPKLTDQGYVFIDEYVLPDYCALFWSERYWRTRFDRHPPGLIGSGSGIGTGGYYLGPFDWGNDPTSIAYTRKDMSGFWNYYPDGEMSEDDQGRVGCRRLRVSRERPHLNRHVGLVAKRMPTPVCRPATQVADEDPSISPRVDRVNLEPRALEQRPQASGGKTPVVLEAPCRQLVDLIRNGVETITCPSGGTELPQVCRRCTGIDHVLEDLLAQHDVEPPAFGQGGTEVELGVHEARVVRPGQRCIGVAADLGRAAGRGVESREVRRDRSVQGHPLPLVRSRGRLRPAQVAQ